MSRPKITLHEKETELHQFWIQDCHPIALVSPKVIWQKVEYIHQNPVRAGWMEKAEAYLYSSARNYVFENEGYLLELDLLEPYPPGSSFVYFPGFNDQSRRKIVGLF